MTDAEADKIAAELLERMEAEMRETVFGGDVQEQRMTALRVRGMSFETVQLDDNGFVIEPVRCTCGKGSVFLFYSNDCPLHKGWNVT